MKLRIAIGPSSFAEEDPTPLRMLEAAGVEIVPNPFRRRLTEAEILAHLVDIDGLIAGLEPLNRRVLSASRPRLQAIARVGIGMNNVDQVAARELGIKVSSTPDGPTEAVAEITLAALLCLARNLESSNRALHAGEWPKTIGRSIAELSVLVVGFGRIGRQVAALLAQLGARVVVCDPFLPDTVSTAPFPRVTLLEGLAESDVVTLHASGDQPILLDEHFARARKGLVLLNSARGELVDEAALVRALRTGQVAKAWFDAFWREPYTGPLTEFPQVLMTPHCATYTRRCRLSMESEAVRNLLRDLGCGSVASGA